MKDTRVLHVVPTHVFTAHSDDLSPWLCNALRTRLTHDLVSACASADICRMKLFSCRWW